MLLGAHRIEVFHFGVPEAGGDGLGGDDCRHGVPVTHGFAHSHDVRHHALRLEGPHVTARPPEAHLHLVGDAHPPCSADIPR